MDIKAELIEIVKNYTDVPENEIDPSLGLKYLGLNSYVVLSMIGDIEDRFNVAIPDRDLRCFQSLNDIVSYLSDRVEK